MPLSPTTRRQLCLLLLHLVQSPDLSLRLVVEKVSGCVPRQVCRRWAGCISRVEEEGVAGIMDTVASIEKVNPPNCSNNHFFKSTNLHYQSIKKSPKL